MCQFTEILWCPGRLCQLVNRDLMVPRLCQFYTCSDIAEILWCPDYVNFQRFFQRFYGAPTMSIYRDFMVPQLSQFTEILQRFQCAPTMSIYRDFAEISWCPDYVNLQRFCRDFMVPWLCQLIYRDFMVPWLCQFTEILHHKTNPVKSL